MATHPPLPLSLQWEIMIIGPNGTLRSIPAKEMTRLLTRSYLASDTLYEGGFLRAELIFPPVSRSRADKASAL